MQVTTAGSYDLDMTDCSINTFDHILGKPAERVEHASWDITHCEELEEIKMPTGLCANVAKIHFDRLGIESFSLPPKWKILGKIDVGIKLCPFVESIDLTGLCAGNDVNVLLRSLHGLNSLRLPSTLSVARDYGPIFEDCSGLTEINLPQKLVSQTTELKLAYLHRLGSARFPARWEVKKAMTIEVDFCNQLGDLRLSSELKAEMANEWKCESATLKLKHLSILKSLNLPASWVAKKNITVRIESCIGLTDLVFTGALNCKSLHLKFRALPALKYNLKIAKTSATLPFPKASAAQRRIWILTTLSFPSSHFSPQIGVGGPAVVVTERC
eukprot:g67358.t1